MWSTGSGSARNARAALIARGYAEMLRFGEALGARAETLAGLCGLGDLVLTCSSTSSRNFSLGKALGEGRKADELMADRKTDEGAHTAPVLVELAARHAIAMPIVTAVYDLLKGDEPRARGVRAAVAAAARRTGQRRGSTKPDEDLSALAKGGRQNFFGFILRLVARLPFLFIAGASTA